MFNTLIIGKRKMLNKEKKYAQIIHQWCGKIMLAEDVKQKPEKATK